MATITLPEVETRETKDHNQVCVLVRRRQGGRRQDERRSRRKGAGLAEMTNAGCRCLGLHNSDRGVPRVHAKLLRRRKSTADGRISGKAGGVAGAETGPGDHSPLVSKRTGSKFSMPGMMDTILNLGLNDKSVEALPSAAIILGSRGFLPAADSDVRQRRARH